MNKKQLEEYNRIQSEKNKFILNLTERVSEHPNYMNCQIAVDSIMDFYNYESGTVVGISPTREGFDNLHENYSDLYRGGFREIKVGNDYVIYGFEFD